MFSIFAKQSRMLGNLRIPNCLLNYNFSRSL
nr:MAG TPA: hypothetical protein [Caudoviricetes sp.]